jgi:hypothetical protein
MANNPYSPPGADVSDQVLTVPIGAMPRTVLLGLGIHAVIAAYALYSTFVRYTAPQFSTLFERVSEQGTWLLFWQFGLPLTLLVLQVTAIVFAFRRKQWARITLLVLLAWGILTSLMSMYAFSLRPGMLGRVLTPILVLWGVLIVRGVAVGLLFTPSANAWFRPRAVR